MKLIWEKPVITFYKERIDRIEKEPFVAVKAQRLVVSQKNEDKKFSCILQDFFPIMGKLDYVFTEEGRIDKYVLCWFDDNEDDFSKAFRRLTGAVFSNGIKCITNENKKIICNCVFQAKHGKLV